MARRFNRVRRIGDIASHRELREVQDRLRARIWYAEQRLVDDFEATFSAENLLDMIAPPGSVLDRIVGWAETGFATARGIFGAVESFRKRRR